MRGNWNNNLTWDNSGYWDSDGPISAVGVLVKQCCGDDASLATPNGIFGEAAIDAAPLDDGDGLARYYPLWLDAHELKMAVDLNGNPDPVELARIQGRGRDIAHQIDAAAFGVARPADDGLLCELPEQFRSGRYYEIPIDRLLPTEKPTRQFNWPAGFTFSCLVRRVDLKRETTLFTLDPSLRLGITWLSELTIELQFENGTSARAWSTIELSQTEIMHVALRVDFALGQIVVDVNGSRAVSLAITRPLAAIETAYFGQWSGGSLLHADAQDLRFYRDVRSTEFIIAESNSYCADWIEVLT